MPEKFIPPHDGYEKLFSFQKARIVMTGRFDSVNASSHAPTAPATQMIQAARSGKQNIIEGRQASGTSKETEIKLTSVARASLEELLEDYRDFLRLRSIAEWSAGHTYSTRLRELNRQPGADYDTFKRGIEHPDPAIAANVMIGLIKATTYLLDRQISKLETAFVQEGGLRERMTHARLTERRKAN